MPHPDIRNETPFVFAPIFLQDEEGRSALIPTIKATFAIEHGKLPALAEEQLELVALGELYGEPGTSSYKFESEASLPKPSTNVVLLGHAYAPFAGATETRVGLSVGRMSVKAKVIGDRFWERGLGSISMTAPQPFDRIPLTWERAFGGWDRRFAAPELCSFEPKNPVGRGFVGQRSRMDAPHPLPNIESLRQPIQNYGDTPVPVGFGFTSPNWQPRASFGGTYDEEWRKQRMPRLPRDFDRRFLNSAPEGLIADGFLQGGEQVTVENANESGLLQFPLPSIAAHTVEVRVRGGRVTSVVCNLDTVVIDADSSRLILIWRGMATGHRDPNQVLSLRIPECAVERK